MPNKIPWAAQTMNAALPANFRVDHDDKYGQLRMVDVLAELCENAPWCNQALTTVNDAVVRLEISQGDFPWHKHTDRQEFFFVLEGEIVLDIEGREPVRLL